MSRPNPNDFRVLPPNDEDLIPLYIGSDVSKPFWIKWKVLREILTPIIPSGTAAWGSIATGTGVGSQADLVSYLNANYIDPAELAAALSNYVPTSRTLTINGVTYDLSANRSWTISGGGAVDSVNGQTGIVVLELNDIDDVNAPSPSAGQVLQWNGTEWVAATISGTGAVTSVAATVPSPTNPAFSVSVPNPTTTPSIDITANGIVSQYIRGDGSLANFPLSGGGGSSLNYYLNGSVSQGTLGGVAFKQMSSTPVIGGGTNFSISSDGYIESFITDASVPNQLLIPAGNWLFEMYFQASSSGGSPRFYIEIYKLSGGTLSLIASSVANPEFITNGTQIDLYTTAVAVPSTVLLAADRIAVRVYVIHSGRTITLHTENSNLCEVITTFSTGITALNGLTAQIQNLATGTSGTDFGITSATDTHTFNLPTASAANRGALSSADWSTFNGKQDALTTTKSVNISTNNVELDGDETTPAANKYYGTDGSGNRGYHILNQVPVPYLYTRKTYSLIGTYLTSTAYYNNLLYFASFFIGGGTGGTQIFNATTAAFNSTSTFTQALYNRIVNNGGTDEIYVISQSQTTIQRLTASTGAFIANTALTGVITTGVSTRFCQFNSTKVFFGNSANFFVLNPTTFVTTSLTAHGLGNIPYVAVNNNPSSPQNGTIMMGGPNGIILINGTTNAISVAATTVSGAISAVYDVQYDATNDVWIVLTVISNSLRIVYLKPSTATTFTVPTTIFGVSAMGSAFAAGAAIYARLLIDEANDYLFLFSNHRLTQIRLSTGDIIQSLPIQSTSPAVTTAVFSSADIDLTNKRIFAASGLNSGAGQWAVNEIMYT
jgi:hypothetical protein